MVSAESLIKSIGDSPMPPVEQWDPDYCGELELLIKADGSWFYQGTPLTRRKIQLLFSRVIKKQADDYFLVTPVEKLGIQVEWQPFVIIDFEVSTKSGQPTYQFFDNCDNRIRLTDEDQLIMSSFEGQSLPCLNIRRNLYASFNRATYYRLIESARTIEGDDLHQVMIQSNGIDFCLGEFR